ncbi:vWA domain-containing protein [Goodfellowiella coeruleoviolacea]|uniref:von Willebrand factor type A domain-containing protein n=1 Tax=Goodfellowiella coeruleoviolacea TaxID=334858 RepID=A0AAE3GFV6_9PSEU|nr:vWA domain-containing protein [Goodfellowiella coeruleoviolacea]MCP2167446.1 von Willebrand factor type A domain-containing protein [Goodfellowiella coeruleoviolacea]
MTRVADSASHRLAVVPGGGPISGHRVGVPVGDGSGPCLLSVRTGSGWLRAAVFAAESDAVPAGFVAVDEELAGAWDVDASDRPEWLLERATPVPVRRLVLELPTERDPGEAARDVARAGLVGALLWVPAGGADVSLPVDGLPHRVREIDLGGRADVVAGVTRDTVVELHASAVRAGVDIVVLADCSNSMSVDDLPVGVESRRFFGSTERWITRMEALKRSLHELLDMRLQISGRVSRLALLEFNTHVRHRFPRQGGMAQLDGSSPESLVTEFRHAVALLRPNGGTDIGNALHEAANLLYQHGRPGNEKLIVLVSDGANWSPAGDQGTGEVVHTVEEPVSLVAHLHRDVGIRLHAIGISTAELFRRRRAYQPNESVVPNHALLEELVKVGGGDPTTVGGLDVLADYFAGLGGGIIHRVGERLSEPPRPGRLPDHTRAALDRLRSVGTGDWDERRADLRGRISELAGRCDTEAQRVLGRPVWKEESIMRLSSREFGRLLAADHELTRFLVGLCGGLRPSHDSGHFAPLRAVLDGLSAAVAGQSADYARLGAVSGLPVDSPASAQVAVMQRVHDVLADLHRALSDARPLVSPADATTDVPSGEPPGGAPDGTPTTAKRRFTYLE